MPVVVPAPTRPLQFEAYKDEGPRSSATRASCPSSPATWCCAAWACCCARLDFCEAERRKDRQRIEELLKQNKHLQTKLQEVNDFLVEGSKTALDHALVQGPRAERASDMNVAELQWLQEACEKLKERDLRLPAVARILGVVADAQGKIEINLQEASSLQLWHLYYFLKHKVLHKQYNLTARGQQELDAVEDLPQPPAPAGGPQPGRARRLAGRRLLRGGGRAARRDG